MHKIYVRFGLLLGSVLGVILALGMIIPGSARAAETRPNPPEAPSFQPTPAAQLPVTNASSAPSVLPVDESVTQTTSTHGRIEKADIRSPLLKLPMEVRVYLPPGYDQESTRRYPVLYLIHGQNFTEDQWDRIGADETADRLVADGEVAPFLIVMPHDRLWTSPDASPFGTVFIEKLIPWVDSTYRTLPDRANRAIGGLSRGAAWAVHLGISNWDKFGIIGVHSGFYFQGKEYQTRKWLPAIPSDSLPRMFVDIGSGDHLLSANEQLEDMLLKNNIPHEYYLYPGRHEEVYWSSHVEQYLRWYAQDW